MLLVGACGGGSGADSLSLNEYFQRLQVLSDEAAESASELDNVSCPSTAESEQDLAAGNFDAIAVAFDQGLDVFRDLLNGVRDLNPPNEAQGPHDILVGALDDFIGGNENLVGRIRDARTEAEFSAILENAPAEAEEAAIGRACGDLQRVATDNNINVDLDCGGDGE